MKFYSMFAIAAALTVQFGLSAAGAATRADGKSPVPALGQLNGETATMALNAIQHAGLVQMIGGSESTTKWAVENDTKCVLYTGEGGNGAADASLICKVSGVEVTVAQGETSIDLARNLNSISFLLYIDGGMGKQHFKVGAKECSFDDGGLNGITEKASLACK